jgi:pimeloyl-ACP methyl ester carboxylesterase
MQTMERRINGLAVHVVEHGAGTPLVALHGAGVDHREIEAALEAVLPDDGRGLRRIYPDLPGMGGTGAGDLTSNDDVVTLLVDLVENIAAGPALWLGHSYGAYLARGVAARRPDLVLGLALLCPVAERSGDVPGHEVVRQDAAAYDELDPGQRSGFDEYFVVRTPATARRYRDHVVPGTTLVDEAGLGRIFSGWRVDVGSQVFTAPALIVAGRRDSVVGYTDAIELVEHYPGATLAVVEDAGHALVHERPELVAAFLVDWLDRTRAGRGSSEQQPQQDHQQQ